MAKRHIQQSTFTNPKTGRISITEAFGEQCARIVADKIISVYPEFLAEDFCTSVKKEVVGKRYTERVAVIAENLKKHLPHTYTRALRILMQILGPENTKETGMFTDFYWLIPVGKFVEEYGLEHFTVSMKALEKITKRGTAEYAIRPFARRYPEKTLGVCCAWAKSKNFHLRRLASEGLRPKLPWASKLDVWLNNPTPVFEILELLREDDVKFVKRSVANHLRDWLKVNPKEAQKIVSRWSASKNQHTQWILTHAQR